MKKPLKQMINKGKNRQIEIDKKPPNSVGTEEENRSTGREGRLLMSLPSYFKCWWLVDRAFV